MLPFHLVTGPLNSNYSKDSAFPIDHSGVDIIGILKMQRSRRTGRHYVRLIHDAQTVAVLEGKDFTLYTDYYAENLHCIMEYLIEVINDSENLVNVIKKNPEKFPSFTVEQPERPWNSVAYKPTTITFDEVNRLLTDNGGYLQIW